MRRILLIFFLLSFALLPTPPARADSRLPAPQLGDDGLYQEPWFTQSFLVLPDDLADATRHGKRLAVIWEQRGCPFCREVHTDYLTDPKVVAYLKAHFSIIQLNLWGDLPVTDFDGKVLPEKEFARAYGIRYTPTIQFFPATLAAMTGKDGQAREAARMVGALGKARFLAMFTYVFDRAYEHATFPQYLAAHSPIPAP